MSIYGIRALSFNESVSVSVANIFRQNIIQNFTVSLKHLCLFPDICRVSIQNKRQRSCKRLFVCRLHNASVREVSPCCGLARGQRLKAAERVPRGFRYTRQSLNRAFLRKACHSDCKAVLSGKDNEGYTPSVNRQRYGKKDDKSILTYPRGREHFVICLLYCYGMVRYRAAPRERNTEMTVIYEK